VIVAVDEASISALGPWPLPRATWARAIERISRDRPLTIGIDVLFSEPSARGPDDDRELAEAIQGAENVVLAAAWTVQREASMLREHVILPTKEIRAGAAAVAAVNSILDDDGVVRRARLAMGHRGDALPAFAVALHRQVRRAGRLVPPIPPGPEVMINYAGGPQTFPRIPLFRVVTGEIAPDVFRQKVVLLGATAPMLRDVFATPLARDGSMPGVEVHANVLETYARGNALREVPAALALGLVVVAALLGSLLVAHMTPTGALSVATSSAAVLLVGAALVFTVWDIWMRSVVAAVLALGLGFFLAIVHHSIAKKQEQPSALRR
jgi:CHASE2 domain-containing sensor protein